MDDMSEKLNSLLANPQLMQQIMTMAQSINSAPPPPQKPEKNTTSSEQTSPIDPTAITKIMSLMGKTGIDSNQKSLLRALGPYVTPQKINKLERAMRAAKLAGAASTAFGNQSNISGNR